MERDYAIRTLLMTDVVGSTRLWSAFPAAMPAAIERMEAIAQAAVAAQGGELVKKRGEGDSLFCVLPSPTAAVRAAVDLVRTLRAEPWPQGLNLRVRTAIHCGPANVRGADVYGPLPNRCARIREVGYGDQILLSGCARDEIATVDGFAFRDLGRHRLRDLDEPERIAQVLASDLPEAFPALRSLSCLRNNLPTQYTSFVGRDALRKDLLRHLREDRLTTLTGAGGSGKTRLALQLAAESIDAFPDGAWFVEMAEVGTEAAALRAIGDACGHRDLPDHDGVRILADRLAGLGSLLLVLDNAEQAVTSIAHVVASLVAAVPSLQILVTSREPLRLRGERVHRVPPLSVPQPGADDPETVVGTEAGALFLDRARLHLPEFTLRATNARAVAEIVRRLDGIPLCLEMAASHVAYLSADGIASRLHDRFALLEGDRADAPARHRTMRETIAWQYDGLVQDEQTLLGRLAVFAGSFDLAAAESVGGGPPLDPDRVLRHLRTLVDKSLVVATPDGGEMRYRLLETIAQYAQELSVDTEETFGALFEWALDLAAAGRAGLYGTDHERWVATLMASEGSIRRVVEWGLAGRDPRAALLVARMSPYWHYRGRFAEGRGFLERALALNSDPAVAADVQNALAIFCTCMGDHAAAATVLERLLQGEISPVKRAKFMGNLAMALSEGGQTERAVSVYQEARQIAEDAGDLRIERSIRYNVGLVLADVGRLEEAIRELMLVASEYERERDASRFALCCVALSGIYVSRSDEVVASSWLGKALSGTLATPSVNFVADALLSATWIAAAREHYDDASYFLGGYERTSADAAVFVSPRNAQIIDWVKQRLQAHASATYNAQVARGRTASLDALLQACRRSVA